MAGMLYSFSLYKNKILTKTNQTENFKTRKLQPHYKALFFIEETKLQIPLTANSMKIIYQQRLPVTIYSYMVVPVCSWGENKNAHRSVLRSVPFPQSQFPKNIVLLLLGKTVATTPSRCLHFLNMSQSLLIGSQFYMMILLKYVPFLHLQPSLPFFLRTGKFIPISPSVLFSEMAPYCLFYNIIRIFYYISSVSRILFKFLLPIPKQSIFVLLGFNYLCLFIGSQNCGKTVKCAGCPDKLFHLRYLCLRAGCFVTLQRWMLICRKLRAMQKISVYRNANYF